MTRPRDELRREFDLPLLDRAFLTRLGSVWETIVQGAERWLLIRAYDLPAGYTCTTVTLGLLIVPGYPDCQLDMVWVSPQLVRADGKPIKNAETIQSVDGTAFQRWSRHRTGENPWRAGEDCLETHLDLVADWFRREFERNP